LRAGRGAATFSVIVSRARIAVTSFGTNTATVRPEWRPERLALHHAEERIGLPLGDEIMISIVATTRGFHIFAVFSSQSREFRHFSVKVLDRR
jgi:hypothetical protein